MNKEEKKAIEYLKKYIKWETFGERSLESDIKTALNYIDKLQKEIESKNKQIKLMQEMNLPKEIEINYISKDIIRDKIKELEEKMNNGECKLALHEFQMEAQIRILKKILGE